MAAANFHAGRTADRSGIEGDQVDGIEKLHDVVHARNGRIADPLRPNDRHVCVDVRSPGHPAIARRQGKQRQLFQHQPQHAGPLDRMRPAGSVGGRTEAGQRPEIQQQQSGGSVTSIGLAIRPSANSTATVST